MKAYFVEWTIEENGNTHNGYTYLLCDTDFNYHVRRYAQKHIRINWCWANDVKTKGVKCYCVGEELAGDVQTLNDLYDAVPSWRDADFIRNACIIEPVGRAFKCRLLVNWWHL